MIGGNEILIGWVTEAAFLLIVSPAVVALREVIDRNAISLYSQNVAAC